MKTRKKNICISMVLALLLLLSACANGNETPSSDSEQPAVTPSEPSAISPAKGTVKTFLLRYTFPEYLFYITRKQYYP